MSCRLLTAGNCMARAQANAPCACRGRNDSNRGTTSVHCSLTGTSLIRYAQQDALLTGYTLTLSRAYPSQPTCFAPPERSAPRSVRSSEMYSPSVTMRLSPPGSSLSSLLKVTPSLHCLCLFILMFRLYKNWPVLSIIIC